VEAEITLDDSRAVSKKNAIAPLSLSRWFGRKNLQCRL
jgi:hypothetical protein